MTGTLSDAEQTMAASGKYGEDRAVDTTNTKRSPKLCKPAIERVKGSYSIAEGNRRIEWYATKADGERIGPFKSRRIAESAIGKEY